jgi:hypothetical protein
LAGFASAQVGTGINNGGGGSGTVGPGTLNKITKFATTTTVGDSSISDDGTTVSTTENVTTTGTLSVGSSAPACTAGTGGGECMPEGTAPTNAASSAAIYADSTKHEVKAATAGSSTFGTLVRTQPGEILQTAKTAAISTATLCAASAGACNIAGQYHIHFNFWGSGTACSSVTAGSVTFLLTWTDENAVAHSAVVVPMLNQTGATSVAQGNAFTFATALANESAFGDITISTNGAVIQYATGYTACTTGTGTYNLRASVTRIQ